MCPKFEVKSFCGWDFNQGVNLPPPPMLQRYPRHPMHNRVNGNEIKSTNQVKLLGITIDDKLNFLPHIRETCKKVNRNSRALIRLRRYLSIEKTHLLCNAYILSNFNYSPLIWSFCSREGNNMINKSHKLVLNIIHSNLQRNRKQSLDELISIENCTTIHIKNLQQLMIEIYKCIHKLNPKFMWELFPSKDLSYQLRTGSTKLIIPPIKTKSYGINSFIFRGRVYYGILYQIR